MIEYHKKCKAVEEEFKQDALVYYGIIGHPKADKAFELAWEHGHSHGFYTIFDCLEELADLLV